MKLSHKLAGLCASAVFLLTLAASVWPYLLFQPDFPMVALGLPVGMALLQMLVMSVSAAMICGSLGYVIGDILSKPEGQREDPKHGLKHSPKEAPEAPAVPEAAKESPDTPAEVPPMPVLEAIRADDGSPSEPS